MNNAASFDHIEVHVQGVSRYAEFLVGLFGGGKHRVIDDIGTVMFLPPKGIPIEIKRRGSTAVHDTWDPTGFCMPCVRRSGAKAWITETLRLPIQKTMTNAEGQVYFFTDEEGIAWHMKDYDHEDRYVGW